MLQKRDKKPKDPKNPKGPQRVKKSVHITNMGENVDGEIKEKTVCEDGVQLLHSSVVTMNLKQQESNKNNDGPLQMAPDPYQQIQEKHKVQEVSFQPQRYWEPDQNLNLPNYNNVGSNWSRHH